MMAGPTNPGSGRWIEWRRLAALTMAIAAVAATRPAVSYRALELGAGPTALAIIAGAFAAFSFVLALRVGARIDRRGERGVFMLGSFLIVVASLTDAAAGAVFILPVAQAVLGLGNTSVGLASQSLAARGGPDHLRDRRFGRNAAAVSLGQIGGPLLGGWILEATREAGWGRPTAAVFGFATFLALVGGLLTWRTSAARPTLAPQPVTKPDSVRSMIRRPGMREALGASIAVMTANNLLVAYLPVLGETSGLSPSFVGALLSIRAGAGLASRIGMDRILRRFSRKPTLLVNILIAGVSMTGFPLTQQPWLLVLFAVGIGYGLGLSQPITASWVSRQVPPGQVAAALALRLTSNRFGQLVLPTALGMLAGPAGTAAIFLGGAAGLLGSSWLISRIELDG
jgi:MFS family permease